MFVSETISATNEIRTIVMWEISDFATTCALVIVHQVRMQADMITFSTLISFVHFLLSMY
jgi:hypothetical protein